MARYKIGISLYGVTSILFQPFVIGTYKPFSRIRILSWNWDIPGYPKNSRDLRNGSLDLWIPVRYRYGTVTVPYRGSGHTEKRSGAYIINKRIRFSHFSKFRHTPGKTYIPKYLNDRFERRELCSLDEGLHGELLHEGLLYYYEISGSDLYA